MPRGLTWLKLFIYKINYAALRSQLHFPEHAIGYNTKPFPYSSVKSLVWRSHTKQMLTFKMWIVCSLLSRANISKWCLQNRFQTTCDTRSKGRGYGKLCIGVPKKPEVERVKHPTFIADFKVAICKKFWWNLWKNQSIGCIKYVAHKIIKWRSCAVEQCTQTNSLREICIRLSRHQKHLKCHNRLDCSTRATE